MKKIYIVLMIVVATQGFAQKNDNFVNNNEVKKFAYQFMGEFCYPQTGVTWYSSDSQERMDWNAFRMGWHIFNNIVYKDKISIGLGTGLEMTPLQNIGIPIFADFRCYFTEKKKIRPFMDIGLGTIITFYNGFTIPQNYREHPGLYFNCTGGFKFYHFQFHAGINMRTNKSNNYYIINYSQLSLDAVIKGGFNF